MLGWDDLAVEQLVSVSAQAKAAETADCFRCDSDSDEGSATCALSLSQCSADSDDGNPHSLWWCPTLIRAIKSVQREPSPACSERAPVRVLSSCSGCCAEAFVFKARLPVRWRQSVNFHETETTLGILGRF